MVNIIKGNRYLSYDILRVMALFFVILTHVTAYLIINFKTAPGNEYLISNIIQFIVFAGVPIFVLLSGALLLNEDKKFDTKTFYKNSFLFLVLLTIGWVVFYGLFYAVILPMISGQPILISNFFIYLISFKGSDYPHLWYMYMVIGLYLLIPVLRLFVKRENKNYILILIFGSILVQFIPNYLDFLTTNLDVTLLNFVNLFYLYPVMGYLPYLLVGWYLTNFKISKRNRSIIYALAILIVVGSFILLQLGYKMRGPTLNGLSISSLLWGSAIFLLVTTIYGDRKTGSNTLITMSKLVFGVYIVHVIFLEIFLRFILPYEQFTLQSPLAYIIIGFLFVTILSYLVVYAISKVKYLKKIVYIKD